MTQTVVEQLTAARPVRATVLGVYLGVCHLAEETETEEKEEYRFEAGDYVWDASEKGELAE